SRLEYRGLSRPRTSHRHFLPMGLTTRTEGTGDWQSTYVIPAIPMQFFALRRVAGLCLLSMRRSTRQKTRTPIISTCRLCPVRQAKTIFRKIQSAKGVHEDFPFSDSPAWNSWRTQSDLCSGVGFSSPVAVP